MAASHVHTKAAVFVSRRPTGGQFGLRSAHELFSQISHSCECGAVRFLVWWLFLHRRLRSGNEARLSSSRLAPLGGSSSKGYHSFLSEWLEKVSRPSLAEPFGSDSGRHRNNSRLLFLSPGASPHRSPIPSSVSKTVTFVTVALYRTTVSQSNF